MRFISIEFAKKDKHTLVVATADHSTGGYSIDARGDYNWFGAPIAAAERQTLKNYVNLQLTSKEIESVRVVAASKNVTY